MLPLRAGLGAIINKETERLTKKAYKTALPNCETCKAEGKKTLTPGPIKTAKGNKVHERQEKTQRNCWMQLQLIFSFSRCLLKHTL